MPKRWGQLQTTNSRNTAFKENSLCVFDVKRSGGHACVDVTSKLWQSLSMKSQRQAFFGMVQAMRFRVMLFYETKGLSYVFSCLSKALPLGF